jgi:hypothetical protein
MTLANESVLLRSDRDGIATLTLNRPTAQGAQRAVERADRRPAA